ncbi:MAG: glycosyltransferase family 39 protein [Gammaproteobacteria bacterium]|nr:glycosyltransferase family 39 protein [Gammaproteobacteria bacterium]
MRLRPAALLLMVLLLLLWFLPLGGWRLFDPDEGRYAEIPREMLTGGDWVIPRLNGIVYLEKPPLQYWVTALAYQAFGVSEWSARLWTALSGVLGVWLVAWLGMRLHGRTAGWLAALVLAGSGYYFLLTRVLTLDMSLSFALQLALTGLVLLVQGGGAAADARVSRLAPWLLAVGVTLAFLSKGLVGILIPGVVAGLYVLLRRDWGLVLRARPWWTLLTLLLLAGPWVWLAAERNGDFLQFFFVHEHFQRFLTRVHDRYEPDWYFIPVLLAGFMPWTTLLPGILAHGWRALRAGERASWMLALWVGFILAFFSLSQSKLIPYILPLFPALALLTGPALERIAPRRLAGHLAAATLAVLLLIALLLWYAGTDAGLRDAARLGQAGVRALYATLLLGAAGLAAGAWWARRGARLAGVAAAAVSSMLTVTGLLYTSNAVERQREQMAVVAHLQAALRPDSAFYCVADYRQPVNFYLRRSCTLVRYQGELQFGLRQEPSRGLPDLTAFAAQWSRARNPVALIRPQVYPELQQMGVPLRVIYTSRSYVAAVRP